MAKVRIVARTTAGATVFRCQAAPAALVPIAGDPVVAVTRWLTRAGAKSATDGECRRLELEIHPEGEVCPHRVP